MYMNKSAVVIAPIACDGMRTGKQEVARSGNGLGTLGFTTEVGGSDLNLKWAELI
jgi:hypothetical protein